MELTLNNGVKMPSIGFGTFEITDPVQCEEAVTEAIQAGYRLIDTAVRYDNEDAVGAGIRNSGVQRKDLFVTTKVWFDCFTSGKCRGSVLSSLERLKLDYLDLVLLHWPIGDTYTAWRELEGLYEEGIIRAIGISNFNPGAMVNFVNHQKVIPAVNQIETHLYCQQPIAHRWMEKYGIAHQAYAPLGRSAAQEIFQSPVVQQIAAAHGKTPAQIVLRYLVQNGISVIPKSVHKERIRENIGIFDFDLSDRDMMLLKAMDQNRLLIGKSDDPEKIERLLGRV